MFCLASFLALFLAALVGFSGEAVRGSLRGSLRRSLPGVGVWLADSLLASLVLPGGFLWVGLGIVPGIVPWVRRCSPDRRLLLGWFLWKAFFLPAVSVRLRVALYDVGSGGWVRV
ncbi:MAG: hypothetical protein IJU53_03865 [Thermoguttaceae bacterium]|nr:hypothetical protein [Thermoguttaceae bacterium]